MKTVLCIIALALGNLFPVHAQWFGNGKRVKGNNDYITKNRTTKEYDRIIVRGGLEVFLVSGAEGNLKIKAESNLIDYIVTEIEENSLKIYVKKGYNLKPSFGKALQITVPFKDIHGVFLSGSGDISGTDTIESSDFKTKVSGSGDIELKVNAKTIMAKVTGSGDLVLKGTTQNFDGNVSGSGDLSAYDLKAENVTASVHGSGDIEITASSSIKARVSGSGDISYKGNPQIEDQKVSGSGDITKH